MRRLTACAMSVVIAIGVLSGTAPAAQASTNLGTVTVTYNPTPRNDYTISPSTLTGEVGDRFTLSNTMIQVNGSLSLVNATGSVTLGVTSCTGDTSCRVMDRSSPPTGVFTITGLGTVTVRRTLNATATPVVYDTIGTITISSGSSSGSGGNAAVDITPKFTATVDANGGTCSGTTSWEKIQGSAAFSGVFALPTAVACTRTNYTLLGWATNASAPAAEFQPGATYTMGDSDVTLYAVWQAKGVLIRYDSNVGMDVQCVTNGVNQARRDGREDVRLISTSTTTEAIRLDSNGTVRWNGQSPTPVCSPPGHTFLGWSTSPSGSPATAVDNGKVITGFPAYPDGRVPDGRQVTLYAQWGAPGTAPAATQVTILITGARTTIDNKAGIRVEGSTTGIAAGRTVVPWIRFPGQTEFTPGSARPVINSDGSFVWERKTGKRTSVYVTLADSEDVRSNRVTIEAR